MSTGSPILFLVFNRPETTQRVFEAIQAARPSRLYVAADGPRPARSDEASRCEAVRRLATAIDWPCELHTLFRSENLGCKLAVSSAITWFFEHESEGLILEDDCLPDPSFFTYVDELLERYRGDERVMWISGDNFISSHWKPPASYYFSRYPHIWGWATWRRAWRHYDVDMLEWSRNDKDAFLQRRLLGLRRARVHWRKTFDIVSTGGIDTWDYQWTYACWRADGIGCLPDVNLVSNIGFGAGATHTISAESKHANLAVASLTQPLRHPTAVRADDAADRWTSQHVFDIDESGSELVRWGRALARRLRWSRPRRSARP
jgi:hypothetical protein